MGWRGELGDGSGGAAYHPVGPDHQPGADSHYRCDGVSRDHSADAGDDVAPNPLEDEAVRKRRKTSPRAEECRVERKSHQPPQQQETPTSRRRPARSSTSWALPGVPVEQGRSTILKSVFSPSPSNPATAMYAYATATSPPLPRHGDCIADTSRADDQLTSHHQDEGRPPRTRAVRVAMYGAALGRGDKQSLTPPGPAGRPGPCPEPPGRRPGPRTWIGTAAARWRRTMRGKPCPQTRCQRGGRPPV